MSVDLRRRWEGVRLEHWLVRDWIAALTELMAALDLLGDGDPSEWRAVPPQPAERDAWRQAAWYEIRLDLAPDAALWIGVDAQVRDAIVHSLFGDEGDEGDEEADNTAESFEELLRQTANSFSDAVSRRLSHEVAVNGFASRPAPPEDEYGVVIERQDAGPASDEEGAPEPLRQRMLLAPNAAMVDAAMSESGTETESLPEGAKAPEGVKGTAGSEGPAGEPAAATAGLPEELAGNRRSLANLQLLLDVELDISVSFGHTELPIEEVLKLACGSIVELNRSANEPVAILVNGSVIAYGDVVVVDGNYGIRITEISSRQERINSIL